MDACPPDDILLDHARARLSRPSAEAVGRHLVGCPACRAAQAELEAVLHEVDRARPEPGPSAEARVFAAIRRAAERAGSRAHRRPAAYRPWRWAAAATFLLAATAALAGLGMQRLRAGSVAATIVSADRDVVVRRGGTHRAAVAGMALREGDELAVAAESIAVLDLPDASRAELGPDSTLMLHEPGGGPLELRGGFLAVDAARRPAGSPLVIRTPGARAEVLGTRFTLGADDDETHLRVAEGLVHLVRVGDGAAVDVAGGHRAAVADGDRAGLESRPSLSGTALIIASDDKAPDAFARFNRLVGDRLLGRRLRHLGFRVEIRPHADVTAEDLAGRPLVIVSYSEENVGFEQSLERVGLRAAGVPVLCFEPAAFPTLAMSGDRRGVDYDWQAGETAVDFPRPEHPLSGGLSGPRRDLFGRPGCFGWARPGPAAERIAIVPGDRDRAILFAYEAGAAMVGGVAPRRRVGLFLDPGQIDESSESAWELVEAAVEWCVEPTRGDQAGGAR